MHTAMRMHYYARRVAFGDSDFSGVRGAVPLSVSAGVINEGHLDFN